MNLRELSELLNLSQTTVSRALNGYPEVSEATRQRVEAAAREHNYQPHAGARRLATGRSMSIGHVISSELQNDFSNIIFAEFMSGASEIYARHGYDVVLKMVGNSDELQAYRDLASRQSVDGVIVHGPAQNDPRIPLLTELGLPFVVHGRSTGITLKYSWVDVNNRRAVARGTRYLLELGHRRIGLINGREVMDFAIRRRSGFLSALQEYDLTPDEALMTSGDMSEPFGYFEALRMLNLDDPPTAFVCSSIVPTHGIRRALEGRNLAIGKDVSVVCFDDAIGYLPNGSADEPTYTATRSPVRAAGKRCAEMLMDRIRDPEGDHQTELWDAELLLGQSTGLALSKGK